MKPFPRILLGLPLALLLSAGACHPVASRGTASLLDDVESYINDRPDSALAVLRALDSTAVRGRALRARTALLHSMALDKCYIDLQTDSILAPAVTWYERHGSPDDKLKTLYYLGRIQYNAGNYQEAIVTYTEALEVTDKAKDLKYIGFVNQAIADTYSKTYQDSEALPYLEKAYKTFLQVPDSSLAKRTLYKKGLCLVNQGEWSESDSLFSMLLQNPRFLESLIPRIKADFALQKMLKEENNTRTAVRLFQEAINESGVLPSANHWAAYAYALSRDDKPEMAMTVLEQVEDMFPISGQVLYWKNRIYHENGLLETAYESLNKTLSYQDSVFRHQLTYSTMTAQKEYFENQTILAEAWDLKRRYLLWMMFFGIIVVLLTLFLIVRKRIEEAHREQNRLQQIVETVNKQLTNAQTEKERWHVQFIQLFQDHFKTLAKICADYEENKFDRNIASDRVLLRRIDFIIREFTGNADNHRAFEEKLDKHLNNIMTDFRRDFQKLSTKDYLLAGYLFAGIDLQTISVLMDLDIDPLYTRKSRLKNTILKSNHCEKGRYLDFF